MEYEEQVTISTPEGVEIELPLAGLGGRFTAALIDFLLKGVIVGVVAATLASTGAGGVVTTIVLSVAGFAALFLYDVLFETLAGGQTPGKRLNGLRVVRTGGEPVGLRTSFVRNLLRALEGFPTSYIPAMISILVTRRNQRLGDLAAGTLVVREPRAADAPADRGDRSRHSARPEAALDWDVSAVTAQELAIVRQFLERRSVLDGDARSRLADELAGRLRPRVAGAAEQARSEEFLEGVVAAKLGRG